MFSFFTVVDQGPFSVVLLCSQMSSAILKGHWLTKKEERKRKSNLHPSPKLSSSPTLSSLKRVAYVSV